MNEKEAIMKANYIENEMEVFLFNILTLIQAELHRSFGCVQLLTDYYNVLAQAEQ